MKHLNIEWRHLEENRETCLRCSKTGKTLNRVIEELAKELEPRGVKVTFSETKLPTHQIAQSNMILFNGVSLEDVLSNIKVSENLCSSCCSFTGKETYCRTIEYEGKVYEEIPEAIIR